MGNPKGLADERHENKDVWTRDQAFGGVGEAYEPDTVEDSDDNVFCGFEADVEIDVEKQLDDEFDRMERGDSE